MKIAIFFLISVFITGSFVFAEGNNESAWPDSINDPPKDQIKIPALQDHLTKDILGNPVLDKTREDYEKLDRDEQEEEAESYLFSWALIILASPLFLPQKLLEDDYSDTFYYQNYPFEKGDGFTEFDGRKWMINSVFSFQFVSKEIRGYHLNPSLSFLRLSLEAIYSKFERKHENIDTYLSAWDAVISFVFAQNQFINFRSGLGYQHFEYETKEDGIKWIYEIQIFQRPFSLNLDYGLIFYDLRSNDTNNIINEFILNAGIHSQRFEFKIGYRFFKIIEEELNGPEVSAGIWF